MNPEIRFRVPEHVHQLANERAGKMGLKSRRGLTGGASELARCALYTFLGLGLPELSEQLLEHGDFSKVRATRDEFQDPDPGVLRVTVHHRVSDEFRKTKALEGRAVASRQTTEFQFAPGELPEFLVPFVLLTERGKAFVSLNLEGRLSPRTGALGELQSSAEHATLEELKGCLQALTRKRKEREAERISREERHLKGKQILQDWACRNGSELLQARLDGGFDWLEQACLEYALFQLAKLDLTDLTPLPVTRALHEPAPRYRNPRPQTKPQLATLKTFQRLQELQDEGLEFSVVLVDDSHTREIREAVQVSFALPVPGRLHFLTDLRPLPN